MELVYLWVEKYKNIRNQGFNFSPRFECKYDENSKELTINENKEYVSIFPDNINVTAIVGENGSGKSSILELLPYGGKMLEANKLTFLFFKKDDKYILLKPSAKEIKINKDFGGKIKEEDIEKFDFSNNNTIKRISFDTDFTRENFTDKDLISFIRNITKYGKDFKEDYLDDNNKNFSILRYKILINQLIYGQINKLKDFDVFIPKYIKVSKNNAGNILETELKKIKNIENDFIEKIKKSEDIYIYFLIYVLIRYKLIDKIKQNNIEVEELENIINISSSKHSDYEKIKNNLLKIKSILNSLKYNKKIYLDECDNDMKLIFWETIQELISIDFYDENDICFSDLSYGERGFYIHFLFLLFLDENHSESNEKENTFFLIDEPDTTFHPNWQKKYINQLLSIYKNYKKNIHLIITSHSPFILSDLPKENIIFLEKGKQVYPFEDNQQTFGANIHTLLSHGFFMKDGLMGEFAKEKIDLAIKYLNQKILTKDELNYCENIISIIGEPIIKRELQRMIDSKRLSEIDLIKKQIAELQQELDKKENKK
ncbi:MAG: AAA family ATPase [Arcobacter sp.]|jgi:predicted ATPase|uniref:AAA family ATPase n=1 Tax=Arcobacter sp. TaxID=1872629 RepID=UPI002A7543BF|nr:AAA family ATPase [Arcobacter sp.]MDY3203576.1 AAA family ATPase [Arcobacter sp.]